MVFDIVAVGNVNIDMIFAHVPSVPRWGEELLVPNFEMRLAGSAGYFAIASARLGMKCGLVSGVGDDVYGDFMLKELKREGIKALVRVERRMASGVCISIVRKDGERAFVSYVGNLAKLSLADIMCSFEFIMRAHALYYGGYFFMQNLMADKAREMMSSFRNVGVVTVLDTGWDPEGWAPRTVKWIRRILKSVSVFLPNAKEAWGITGCKSPVKAARKLLSYGPEVIAIKLGPGGCLVADKKEITKIPGFKCDAFDATGAGDAFNAGFMFGYLRGWDLRRVAEFANATGALTVSSRRKGEDRFPTRKEVEDLLK